MLVFKHFLNPFKVL